MTKNPFTDHPETVGETYLEHLAMAGGFAGAMFLGGLACLVHAVLPFAFESTGSGIIKKLYGRMVTHRDTRGSDKKFPGTEVRVT